MIETGGRKGLIRGVLYTAVAKYTGVLISLVVSGVLARLIAPHEFGTVAVASVLIFFFSMLSEMGIAPAIVQNKGLERADYERLFSLTFGGALLFSLLFFTLSPAIGGYYRSEDLTIVCRILSVNVFFSTLSVVPNGLLYKHKLFGFISKRALFVQLFCGIAAVVAALNGAGIYALLINPTLSSIAIFIVGFSRFPQRFRLDFSLSTQKKIFGYSLYQFSFNLINYFSRNLDKLLIGRFMDMSLLGYYDKSYRLMMIPLENVSSVFSQVMHPVFSDFQDDLQRLSLAYLKVLRLLGFIGACLSAFLFINARELILIVFGAQWMPSVPVFKILTLTVGLQIIMSTSGSVFQASNATKLLFITGLVSTIMNLTAIVVGIFFFKTVEAVAWGMVVTFTINFFVCFTLLFRCALKSTPVLLFKQLKMPFMMFVILMASGSLLSFSMGEAALLVSFSLKTIVVLLIAVLFVQLSGAYDIRSSVVNILRRRR